MEQDFNKEIAMPIQGSVLKTGATSLTTVGGTDITFTPDGVTVVGGVHVSDASQTDFRIRKNMTVKNRVPSLGADGVYSKDKKSITITCPKILSSGKTVFNLIRIERELHPESTAAEGTELQLLGAQALSDADFTSFWQSGSLA